MVIRRVAAVTGALTLLGMMAAPGAGIEAATATGTVFFPNPVQQLGNESLTDNKDADSAAFTAAYRRVPLTHLDNSGTLSGDYVTVKSTTGKAARMVGGAFPAWHRDADQFEQVMGYYWVTTAQDYLQHLGFGSTLRPVNQRQIELRINQFGGDNSFFRDDKAQHHRVGKGGVDDAEDAEVIVHEYGHSVQDAQVTGFGTDARVGCDRRGVQRLPRGGGHELEGRRADARRPKRAWRTGTRCPTRRPRRIACVASTATSTIPRTSRTKSTATARSGRGRCGTSAPRSATPRRRR